MFVINGDMICFASLKDARGNQKTSHAIIIKYSWIICIYKIPCYFYCPIFPSPSITKYFIYNVLKYCPWVHLFFRAPVATFMWFLCFLDRRMFFTSFLVYASISYIVSSSSLFSCMLAYDYILIFFWTMTTY